MNMSTSDGRTRKAVAAAMPLYAASLVITLAGITAVGVTLTATNWLPVWATLAVVGHVVSIGLRLLRVPPEGLFYPVMLLGTTIGVQQSLMGSPLVGLDGGLGSLPPDQATAALVGILAVTRSFTLVTNGSLLFSTVPTIAMLALAGSANLNREIPLLFGLLVLGAIFASSYDQHLRRAASGGPAPAPLLIHLLTAWILTIAVSVCGLLFPLLVQPVLGPFSPFSLPSVTRLRNILPFNQFSGNQAPVGAGPIALSPIPIFRITTPEGGLFRTGVLTRYTGRGWERDPNYLSTSPSPVEQLDRETTSDSGISTLRSYSRFVLHPYMDTTADLPRREVKQVVRTLEYAPQGIPALGRVRELLYPSQNVVLFASEELNGRAHQSQGQSMELVSEIADYPPALLARVPPLDTATFPEPETLALPAGTGRVQDLARRITQGLTTPDEQMDAIGRWIQKHCTYTLLEEVTPAGEDAADYYLFETRRGACGLAATATAVMARAVGIPARVAIGYVGEEELPEGGGYLIRHQHAHMWVEAYFTGLGWVPFNPSPSLASTRESMFRLMMYRMRGFLSSFSGGSLDAVLLLVVVFATLVLVGYAGLAHLQRRLKARRRRAELAQSSPVAATALLYADALRLHKLRGWQSDAGLTPLELLDRLRVDWSAAPNAVAAMADLTALYDRAWYAGQADASTAQAAADAYARLRGSIPAAPRPPKQKFARRRLLLRSVR